MGNASTQNSSGMIVLPEVWAYSIVLGEHIPVPQPNSLSALEVLGAKSSSSESSVECRLFRPRASVRCLVRFLGRSAGMPVPTHESSYSELMNSVAGL